MVDLETLLSSIAASVHASQKAIQHHAHQSFLNHFKEENDVAKENDVVSTGQSTFVPILKHFNITGEDDKLVAIPTVALYNHDSLVLENVKVVLNVSGVSDGDKFMVCPEPTANSDDINHHQITLEFKNKDTPEGASRILTSMNQFI